MRPNTLISAIIRIARPLVRAMLARGMHYGETASALKKLFVEEAENSARADGQKPTDSRISVMTGLQRRDVKALRSPAPPQHHRSSTPFASQLLRMWRSDPALRDTAGEILDLPRRAEKGAPSFDGLCQSITRDVHPRTLLDELERTQMVTVDPSSGAVRLAPTLERPPASLTQLTAHFAANLGDHAEAATANFLSAAGEPPFLERSVSFNELTPASIARLEELARRLSQDALREINAEALRLKRQDLGAPDARMRFRYGAFFYTTASEKAADPPL